MTSRILAEPLPTPDKADSFLTPTPEQLATGLDKLLQGAGLSATIFFVICAVVGVVLAAALLLCIWCCCRAKRADNEVQSFGSAQPMQIQSASRTRGSGASKY